MVQNIDTQSDILSQFASEMSEKRFGIGERIRLECEKQNLSKAAFGRLIDKSRQNVEDIFKRETIDTTLLFNISQKLDYDFFQIYQKELSFYRRMQQQILALEEEISYQKNIIRALVEPRNETDAHIIREIITVCQGNTITVTVGRKSFTGEVVKEEFGAYFNKTSFRLMEELNRDDSALKSYQKTKMKVRDKSREDWNEKHTKKIEFSAVTKITTRSQALIDDIREKTPGMDIDKYIALEV